MLNSVISSYTYMSNNSCDSIFLFDFNACKNSTSFYSFSANFSLYFDEFPSYVFYLVMAPSLASQDIKVDEELLLVPNKCDANFSVSP